MALIRVLDVKSWGRPDEQSPVAWGDMPPGPAAATAAEHTERIPPEVLFQRLQRRALGVPIYDIVLWLEVALSVAYAVFIFVMGNDGDRFFGFLVLLWAAFLVFDEYTLLLCERMIINEAAEELIAARLGCTRDMVDHVLAHRHREGVVAKSSAPSPPHLSLAPNTTAEAAAEHEAAKCDELRG